MEGQLDAISDFILGDKMRSIKQYSKVSFHFNSIIYKICNNHMSYVNVCVYIHIMLL